MRGAWLLSGNKSSLDGHDGIVTALKIRLVRVDVSVSWVVVFADWLCREAKAGLWQTPVYFGTGSEDRFLRGQRMLADLLPSERVRILPGAHDWPTWQRLWHDWLGHGPWSG